MLLGYIALRLVYNLFFHPLRRFPGPVGRRISDLPNVFSLLRGKWTRDLLPLVEKYGPVVRIGPNHLIFTDPDAWKDIYSHHNGAVVKGEEFEKNMLFYRNRGVQPSILAETRDNHALIRRHLSHGFSEKSLRDQEPIVKGYVDLLMRRLRERCVAVRGAKTGKESGLESKTAFDMRRWYTFTTFDVIGDMAFGEPFGCLEQGEANERVTTIEQGLISQHLGIAVKLLGLERLHEVLVKGRAVFRRNILRQMTDTLRRRMELSMERPDLIEGLLSKKGDWNIPFDVLRANAIILVIAGSETTATLLSGITYLLLKNPECLEKAKEEVRSSFTHEDEITFSSVQNLSYSSSRNFSDPFSFKPERFLEPENFLNDRLDAVQPFSVGPRDCIGKNLAYAEMRTILARLLFNFDMELADPEQDWLDQKVFFLWTKPPLNVYLTPVR
ncbi:hypothetical protein SLS53_001882 [Cytospora paraplurivora]|uniref:Cytochrome P450 n=1 Tax=Cytospora paraplurivora TaxID=2898453 RepID=A0AAN9UHQ1_9PEZI